MIEMTVVSNQENTEFRLQIEGQPSWTRLGKGKILTIAVPEDHPFTIAAKPDGYRERRHTMVKPLKNAPLRFTFEIGDRDGLVTDARPYAAPEAIPRPVPEAIPRPVPEAIPDGTIPRHSQYRPDPILQRWAVVIGVSEYADHRIPDLNYAARDARAFYDWLTSAQGGYAKARVHLLLNREATLRNISNALVYGLRRASKDDLVVIYFSGHGTPESPDKPDILYLLPSDADFEFIATSAFPMEDIERALAKHIPASRVVIIADACHAGGVGEAFSTVRRAVGLAPVSQVNEGLHALARDDAGHSVAVLTSADTDALSQEDGKWGGGHGVFTFYLLKGLKGEADSNGDRRVSLAELSLFVSQGVRDETNGAQRPRMAGNFDPSLVIGE